MNKKIADLHSIQRDMFTYISKFINIQILPLEINFDYQRKSISDIHFLQDTHHSEDF